MNHDALIAYLQTFEAYQKQTLSEQESHKLEAELNQNPALKAIYEEYLLGKWASWKAGTQAEKEAFKEIWAEIRDDVSVQAPTRSLRRAPQWMWAAAAAVVLFFTIGFWALSNNTVSYPELADNYYELPRVSETMGSATEDLLTQAKREYAKGEYANAADLFSQYLASQEIENGPEAQFYLGISQLELGQLSQAEQSLQKASYQAEMTDWYLAMVYLKAEKSTELRQQLDQILGQEGHYYQEKAQALKSEIE